MKGIVFNLLEEVVKKNFGEEVWDKLLFDARLPGAYTSLGNYADNDLDGLVQAASVRLNLPPQDVILWFGRNAIPILAGRYPQFFSRHKTTRAFLLTLNDVIYPEVRKIYEGAVFPEFEFDTFSDDILVIKYQSPRKLCSFVQGMTEGATVHFDETVSISESSCMLRGDQFCKRYVWFKPNIAPR